MVRGLNGKLFTVWDWEHWEEIQGLGKTFPTSRGSVQDSQPEGLYGDSRDRSQVLNYLIMGFSKTTPLLLKEA